MRLCLRPWRFQDVSQRSLLRVRRRFGRWQKRVSDNRCYALRQSIRGETLFSAPPEAAQHTNPSLAGRVHDPGMITRSTGTFSRAHAKGR
jgi:hypothetical protein